MQCETLEIIWLFSSAQVKCEGKTSYMTAVCMGCLEGWTGNGIVCRFCLKPWTGGHLILGTMYSYDIFAAMPCCQKRFQVSFRNKVQLKEVSRAYNY